MPTDMKRFTVSITKEMEKDLSDQKKETYYANTQSEMIRDLIRRGLEDLKREKSFLDKNKG